MALLPSVLSVVLVLVAVTVLAPGEASAAMGKLGDNSAFFKHYAKFHVLSHCFGEQTVVGWNVYIDNLITECQGEVRQRRSLARAARSLSGVKSENVTYYTADKIRQIKNKMASKIMFMNCTMNKMNMTMTPEGGVNTVPLIDYYKTLSLDSSFMADLADEIKKCGLAAMCGEYPSYGPINPDFQKKVNFMKCEQDARLMSCVRKDLRLHRNQFDFEGLDGLLNDVLEDEDKMFAIMSAKVTLDESDIFI